MIYTIKTSRSFEKDFSKLDSLTQNRVLIALEKMKKNPFLQVKKLKKVNAGIYRLRIGDYRIRFDLIDEDIYLYRVRHRKNVYR